MKNTARSAAFAALERCRKQGAWSGASVDLTLRTAELDSRDSALATRLVLGVLQNSSFCDYYIDLFCNQSIEPKLRVILRLGAYQLLFLDKVPVHAAVSETVSLCRDQGLDRAAGLVNAVLRRIADQRSSLPPIPGEGSAQYLSVRYSHPLWLAERLIRQYGYAFTEAFFAENNSPAPLCIQINSLKVSPEDYQRTLTEAGIPYHSYPELPGCLELSGGRVSDLPGFDEGLFFVQDRAARMAVEAAGIQPGMRILDACAAPGGKSFAAAVMGAGRCSILACDIHEKKLRLIREGAQRLGLDGIETVARDARVYDASMEKAFDTVIADVPCSGLGVIRKRPEIRWKTEESLAALPEIQGEILNNVCRFVRPGGVLLYSTCTVLAEENREQIRSFLSNHPDYMTEDFAVGGIRSQEGCYDFWPQKDGSDGFFAAKLRRIVT